jgi:hypothetical protein
MVRKWCRDDAIIKMGDVKWFISWRVYDCPYFFLGVEKEWPSKVYYRGELPPELSKILTPT